MKDIRELSLAATVKGLRLVANQASGSRCITFIHEPKIPAALRNKQSENAEDKTSTEKNDW